MHLINNVKKEVHMFHLKQLFVFEQIISRLKSQRRSGSQKNEFTNRILKDYWDGYGNTNNY